MAKYDKYRKEKDYNYALMGMVLLVAIIGLMMALWSPAIVPPETQSGLAAQRSNYYGYETLGRCTDYGQMKDYYSASYAIDKDGIHNDYCLSQNTLREYYCVIEKGLSSLKYSDFKCPYGCEAGACKSG